MTMIKFTVRGRKVLKIFHLLFVVIWVGPALIMNSLRLLVDATDAPGMYYMAAVLEAIDMDILVPGAIGTLLTGLLYSLFTHWGFFKHHWITVKWVLTLFMIIFGTFYMGPRTEENVGIASQLMEGGGNAAEYYANVSDTTWSGLLQVALLLFVMVISVWKPWGQKNKK